MDALYHTLELRRVNDALEFIENGSTVLTLPNQDHRSIHQWLPVSRVSEWQASRGVSTRHARAPATAEAGHGRNAYPAVVDGNPARPGGRKDEPIQLSDRHTEAVFSADGAM